MSSMSDDLFSSLFVASLWHAVLLDTGLYLMYTISIIYPRITHFLSHCPTYWPHSYLFILLPLIKSLIPRSQFALDASFPGQSMIEYTPLQSCLIY